jgi:alpha-L-fucosidase 2
MSNAGNELVLFYKKPAMNWNEALPIGNGKLAAMLFSGPKRELIQLNEETLWKGGPHNNISGTEKAIIPQLRNLLFAGKYSEAQALSKASIKSPQNGMSYQPAGNVYIDFDHVDAVSDYYRELDISKAVHTVKFQSGNTHHTRTAFASFTENVLVYHCTAKKDNAISFRLTADAPHKHVIQKKSANSTTLVLSAAIDGAEGINGAIRYETIIKVQADGGRISYTDTSIIVKDANSATIYLTIGSNFRNYTDVSNDAGAIAKASLKKALKKNYDQLLYLHTREYQKYFNRVSFSLGKNEGINTSTDERIKNFKQQYDPGLIALYFQFGRYLLLSSSLPGNQPANLQGKWNDKINPAWDSKYTININTEMNYWPSEITGIPETAEPLFRMLKDLSISGQEAAQKIYSARGWVAHHNTDLWRITGVVDGGWYGMWPIGGAWLCRHIWEHYLYTGDKTFLEQYYPVMKGAALYYIDALQKEPKHGWLVVAPSMSPENSYKTDSLGNKLALTYGTTMDNQIVTELFSNVIHAAEILNKDLSFRDTVRQKLNQLPPMQIGHFGQLQEWIFDWDKRNDHHRHISHLFGLYPSNQISPYRNPELFAAAKVTLTERGDVSTGWSMGWKVNFQARMLNGNHAFKLIRDQLSLVSSSGANTKEGGGTYPNLLDAHPPFQIDGNLGCTAGIAEMLLQSHDGAIYILPALPDEWKEGSIKGIRARGGFTLDFDWEKNKLIHLKIHSALGGNCRLRLPKDIIPNGKIKPVRANGANENIFYQLADIKTPLKNNDLPINDIRMPEVEEWDLMTTPGKIYELKFNP